MATKPLYHPLTARQDEREVADRERRLAYWSSVRQGIAQEEERDCAREIRQYTRIGLAIVVAVVCVAIVAVHAWWAA